MQSELFALGEFAKGNAKAYQLLPRHASGKLRLLLAHVVDPVSVQAEAVVAVGPLQQRLDPAPDVLGELGKEDFAAVASRAGARLGACMAVGCCGAVARRTAPPP